jgi:F0F1-type ATP synthase delta subunit
VKLSRRQLAKAVVNQLRIRPANQVARSLAAYLIENNQTSQADLLLRDVALEIQKTEAVLNVSAVSAFTPSRDQLEELADVLKKLTHTKLTKWQLSNDTSLLGGIVISAPEFELDLSLRKKLNKLKAA